MMASIWSVLKKFATHWTKHDSLKHPQRVATGLKDEIERLIQTEKNKLETKDRENQYFNDGQRERFISIRAALQNFIASLDPEYVESIIYDRSARIGIGSKNSNGYFEEDVRWSIEPNYRFRHRNEGGESLYIAEPGFRVEETKYTRFPEYDSTEEILYFESETEVIEHMMEPIAEKIAFYRHLKSKTT